MIMGGLWSFNFQLSNPHYCHNCTAILIQKKKKKYMSNNSISKTGGYPLFGAIEIFDLRSMTSRQNLGHNFLKIMSMSIIKIVALNYCILKETGFHRYWPDFLHRKMTLKICQI